MILVIDDDPGFPELARIALAALRPHGLLFAKTGQRALEILDQLGDQITLALVGLKLPDVNGFELLMQISREHTQLRIIAISAYAYPDVLEAAKFLGATEVLVKPISSQKWDEIIERVSGVRGAGGA